ncbi:MAG: CAP domain-containing protein [Alkalibacterium sp.]|uniref:Cysteine-rich secretory protein family protein n=2 Tax=Alkalibacterium gilvum TaxID=1130080 RepID=A0A1H6UUM4_9LACT|nr:MULTISPECIES: CAP domain-containing protein [Alkalibacterium]MDN6194100.1 CAP domain-containing protein [Alkalibacterium sp.]MDN6294138.1 CAP domain-containing protein [Alkalibacterium sp.]MDN6295701.1 CAP domain-containing protein [Alkalibacterium sp.]MDN6326702.1 CAP domain-containing protein [Alkalibacterium sp.]MDN6385992.1 CAP domain-containing protein [Alkalibacterium sp.]
MRFIRKIITLLLVLMIGFWLGSSGLLNGTQVGKWMNTAVDFFPTQTEIQKLTSSLDTAPTIVEVPSNKYDDTKAEEDSKTIEKTTHTDVNYDSVEQKILTLLNELRQEKNLNTLSSNDALKTAADLRAKETEESFSHTRPDGRGPFTVFENETIDYSYKRVGENLGMATYFKSEEEMAELLFNGWVESQGHYENMVTPEYEEVGIGVHYDGVYLYATQIFGTPFF